MTSTLPTPTRQPGAMIARSIVRSSLVLMLTLGALASVSAGSPAPAAAQPAVPSALAPARAATGDRLIIPSIAFNKPIVEGWTREINAGKITLIGDCWPGTPRTAALPCSTTWIAGHRSTHGSAFKNLPKVKIGSLVTIVHAGTSTTYKIYSKISVVRDNPPLWVFHTDLLLQCSDGSNKAWVLNGRIVSTKTAAK